MEQVGMRVIRPPRRRWRAIGGLLAGLLASVTLGTPAQATIVERGRFADSFTDSYDDCGFTVDVEGSFSGHYRIREGKGDLESAFFFQQVLSWEETHSANGRSITLRGHAVTNEVRARHVEGSIFEFVTIEAGQPFAVYDGEGNLVLRDRGVIRFTFLWDTLGDDEPGGVFIEELDVQFGGPHPGWDLDWSEICALLV
jgi:hypothetical protein